MSKRRQLQWESGVAYRGLFLWGMSKIGELLINSSFSLEKAYISYFAVTGVSKQALLFALIIFFLGSAKCFVQEFSLIQYSGISQRDRVKSPY